MIKLTDMVGYMKRRVSVCAVAVLTMVLGIALLFPGAAQAQQGIPGVDPNSALGKQCTGNPATDDPTACGQGRLLREGTNVFTIYELHAAKKLRLVMCGFGMPVKGDPCKPATPVLAIQDAFDKFTSDGTCLKVDQTGNGGDVTKASETCVKRLKRLAADAAINARKEILRNNTGRRDVLDDKSGTVTDRVFQNQKGNVVDQGADNKGSDTVLKDIGQAVTVDKKTQVMMLLATPHPVDFNNSNTESALGSGDAVTKVRKVDVEEINSDIASKKAGDTSINHYESADEKSDLSLSSDLAVARVSLSKGIDSDKKAFDSLKRDKDTANGTLYNNKIGGKGVGDSVSADALRETMRDLAGQDAANKDKAGNVKTDINLSVLDTKNTVAPISNSDLLGPTKPGEKPSGTTDDVLKTELHDAIDASK